MASIFLESTTPGKHFSLSVYKPDRGPAQVHASEGICEYREDGSVRTFTTELFGVDRFHRIPLGGNCTAKNKARGLGGMHNILEDMGWIVKGQSLPLAY